MWYIIWDISKRRIVGYARLVACVISFEDGNKYCRKCEVYYYQKLFNSFALRLRPSFVPSPPCIPRLTRAGYVSAICPVVEQVTGNKPISFSQFAKDYAGAPPLNQP
jgi:hypothetical protein